MFMLWNTAWVRNIWRNAQGKPAFLLSAAGNAMASSRLM